jgi:prepilin-type N-terminal cleavage/methylation domain-containing protein
MKIRTRLSPRAFTLLEIMVALALFGMIVAAIYSSWFAIMRGSKSGLAAAAAAQRSRVAVRTMEEALCSVRSFAADIQYYSFLAENGSSDASLSFVSRLSDSFPRSGKFGDFNVRRVTFSLESSESGSGSQLVLRQNPVLMELDKDEMEHPVVLAKEVQ